MEAPSESFGGIQGIVPRGPSRDCTACRQSGGLDLGREMRHLSSVPELMCSGHRPLGILGLGGGW